MHALLFAAALAAAPSPFPPEVYRARRERLAPALKGCAAVLVSRTKDESLDGYFYWLTGVSEPDAAVILAPKEALLLAPLQPEPERFTGQREPIRPALRARYGFDRIARTGFLKPILFNALRRVKCVARVDPAPGPESPETKLLAEVTPAFDLGPTVQAWTALERLRLVKEPRELERLERAIAISIEGHRAAMRAARAGVTERQVNQAVIAALQAAGATSLPYSPIVGAGVDGAILHWDARDVPLAADDLLLVDAAGSFRDYAADLTRTFPVSGSFSPEQRRMYDTVLRAQDAALALVRPGATLFQLGRAAEKVIVEAGYQDGLIHAVGHFVGLEVHDPPIDLDFPFEPGMVITVEPGIYIPEKRVGIRIEDMVLVTRDGGRLLTAGIPRSAEEVERFVAAAREGRAPPPPSEARPKER